MDIKEYLAAGERLESVCSPAPWRSGKALDEGSWRDFAERLYFVVIGGDNCEAVSTQADDPRDSANVDFIADARERLPKYRKALEAVLANLEERKNWPDSIDWEISEAIRKALE